MVSVHASSIAKSCSIAEGPSGPKVATMPSVINSHPCAGDRPKGSLEAKWRYTEHFTLCCLGNELAGSTIQRGMRGKCFQVSMSVPSQDLFIDSNLTRKRFDIWTAEVWR